jgi:hypothetical protein
MVDRISTPATSGAPPVASAPKLLDRVREAIRTGHYSRRTETAYVAWVRRFIVFHGKRHPRELGSPAVTAFISSLAARGVSASTQNQAVSAVIFLFEVVLGQRVGWMDEYDDDLYTPPEPGRTRRAKSLDYSRQVRAAHDLGYATPLAQILRYRDLYIPASAGGGFPASDSRSVPYAYTRYAGLPRYTAAVVQVMGYRDQPTVCWAAEWRSECEADCSE